MNTASETINRLIQNQVLLEQEVIRLKKILFDAEKNAPDCRTCNKYTSKGQCSSIGTCGYKYFMYEQKTPIRLYLKQYPAPQSKPARALVEALTDQAGCLDK